VRDAKKVIARQAQEIEQLRLELQSESLAKELRQALTIAATAGVIASPVTQSRLLEMIVQTAAQVIRAKAASLFLVDAASQELVFEVALGEKAEAVKKFRVPLGHGIAGLVAATGQPMAVSSEDGDTRVGADIAKSIGYTPQSVLCVPLSYRDEVIGVIELLDKRDSSGFSVADMESLGLFADQAAVAIEQSRNQHQLALLLGDVLGSLVAADPALGGVRDHVRAFAAALEDDTSYRRAINLASLVHAVASQGANEAQACEAILHAFADFLQAQAQPLQTYMAPP
jgi:GAF domain-containing protein